MCDGYIYASGDLAAVYIRGLSVGLDPDRPALERQPVVGDDIVVDLAVDPRSASSSIGSHRRAEPDAARDKVVASSSAERARCHHLAHTRLLFRRK